MEDPNLLSCQNQERVFRREYHTTVVRFVYFYLEHQFLAAAREGSSSFS